MRTALLNKGVRYSLRRGRRGLPRAADIVVAKLVGARRPRRRRAEPGAVVNAGARIAALELVLDRSDAGGPDAPTPMRLAFGRRRHEHGHRHTPGGVVVAAVPRIRLRLTQGHAVLQRSPACHRFVAQPQASSAAAAVRIRTRFIGIGSFGIGGISNRGRQSLRLSCGDCYPLPNRWQEPYISQSPISK